MGVIEGGTEFYPDGSSGLIGREALSLAVGGPFFKFHRLPLAVDWDFPDRRAAREPDGGFAAAAGEPGKLVQQGRLRFFSPPSDTGFYIPWQPPVFLSWSTPWGRPPFGVLMIVRVTFFVRQQ
jgi:hypothetical protein